MHGQQPEKAPPPPRFSGRHHCQSSNRGHSSMLAHHPSAHLRPGIWSAEEGRGQRVCSPQRQTLPPRWSKRRQLGLRAVPPRRQRIQPRVGVVHPQSLGLGDCAGCFVDCDVSGGVLQTLDWTAPF